VLVEFVCGLIVEALDGGLFNRAVHALDLTIGPGVRRFGQAVFHALCAADAVEAMPTGQELMRLGRELHPVVRQYGMHFIRELVEHAPQKLGRHDPIGPWVQLGKRYFAGAVDGHKQVLAAFFGLLLGKIDVQVADGIVLELLRSTLPILAQGQSANAMALKTAV